MEDYGVSGHGKGLVDAMSSFGVKAPLRKAVITNDFTYSSALDIYNYLISIFQNDNWKHHYYLEKDTINLKTIKNPLKIRGCQNIHIICFNPDNSFVTKINVCSCECCLIGEFLECDKEKGFQMRLSSAQNE